MSNCQPYDSLVLFVDIFLYAFAKSFQNTIAEFIIYIFRRKERMRAFWKNSLDLKALRRFRDDKADSIIQATTAILDDYEKGFVHDD